VSTHYYVSVYRTHAPIHVVSEMGPNTVPSTPVEPIRETTWTHLLSIDSRIPLSNRWSILHNSRWIGIHPTRKSASPSITKRKHHKSYDSFPKQKSVDSHHKSKSSIVCINCFYQFVNPFESLTLRFWYIGRTKSGKIRSGSLLEVSPDRLWQV